MVFGSSPSAQSGFGKFMKVPPRHKMVFGSSPSAQSGFGKFPLGTKLFWEVPPRHKMVLKFQLFWRILSKIHRNSLLSVGCLYVYIVAFKLLPCLEPVPGDHPSASDLGCHRAKAMRGGAQQQRQRNSRWLKGH